MATAAPYFTFRVAAIATFFAVLWFILWRQLSGEWSVNDQYSYGWFVPVFALVLFWLRWEDRPKGRSSELGVESSELSSSSGNFVSAPIRVFEIGNPDWRPLSWLHAICTVTITLGARGFALSQLGVRPYSRMRRG